MLPYGLSPFSTFMRSVLLLRLGWDLLNTETDCRILKGNDCLPLPIEKASVAFQQAKKPLELSTESSSTNKKM